MIRSFLTSTLGSILLCPSHVWTGLNIPGSVHPVPLHPIRIVHRCVRQFCHRCSADDTPSTALVNLLQIPWFLFDTDPGSSPCWNWFFSVSEGQKLPNRTVSTICFIQSPPQSGIDTLLHFNVLSNEHLWNISSCSDASIHLFPPSWMLGDPVDTPFMSVSIHGKDPKS